MLCWGTEAVRASPELLASWREFRVLKSEFPDLQCFSELCPIGLSQLL